jgi:uncharacterized protein
MHHYFLLLALLLLPTASQSTSFDCGKASSRVERLVCTSKDLSALDDSLSELYSAEVEREQIVGLRASQKKWLANRNACEDAPCVTSYYERRIAELSCDPKSQMAGSAIGSNQCSYFSLRELDRQLAALEERYGKKVAEETNNPEYTKSTFAAEQKAWRSYRSAQCDFYGAIEGGADGWKNAFAGICEVDETKKRIARLKTELGTK